MALFSHKICNLHFNSNNINSRIHSSPSSFQYTNVIICACKSLIFHSLRQLHFRVKWASYIQKLPHLTLSYSITSVSGWCKLRVPAVKPFIESVAELGKKHCVCCVLRLFQYQLFASKQNHLMHRK